MKLIRTSAPLLMLIAWSLVNDLQAEQTIIDKSHKHIDYLKTGYDGLYTLKIKTKIDRVITINDAKDIDALNKLYIPTFNDLDFKHKLIDLKASTIKSSGEVIDVDSSEYVRTTLPGNAIFNEGISGNVLAFVFPFLEVGDKISYSYTVEYSSNSRSSLFATTRIARLQERFPVKDFSLEISCGENLNVYGVTHNSSFDWVEQDHSIRLKQADVAPEITEAYGVYEDLNAYAVYRVMSYEPTSTSWEDYFESSSVRTKKKDHFFLGYSLKDLKNETEGIATSEAKIERLVELFRDKLSTHGSRSVAYLLAYDFSSRSDMYALLELLEVLEIDGYVALFKDRSRGALIDGFFTYDQIDELAAVITTSTGQQMLWQPFRPWLQLNEIDAGLCENPILKVTLADKAYHVELEQFDLEVEKSQQVEHAKFAMSFEDDYKLKIERQSEVSLTGNFKTRLMLPFLLMQIDTSDQASFEEMMKRAYNQEMYLSEEVDEIKPKSFFEKEMLMDVGVSYHIRNIGQSDVVIVRLDDLFHLNPLLGDSYKSKRKGPIHLAYQYTRSVTAEVKAPEHYRMLKNDNLNFSFQNEIGEIRSSIKQTSEGISIELFIEVNDEKFAAEQWDAFKAFQRQLYGLGNLPLVLKKDDA